MACHHRSFVAHCQYSAAGSVAGRLGGRLGAGAFTRWRPTRLCGPSRRCPTALPPSPEWLGVSARRRQRRGVRTVLLSRWAVGRVFRRRKTQKGFCEHGRITDSRRCYGSTRRQLGQQRKHRLCADQGNRVPGGVGGRGQPPNRDSCQRRGDRPSLAGILAQWRGSALRSRRNRQGLEYRAGRSPVAEGRAAEPIQGGTHPRYAASGHLIYARG